MEVEGNGGKKIGPTILHACSCFSMPIAVPMTDYL